MTAGTIWRRVCQTLRLMVGLPDYEHYAAHRREHHPGETVMNRAEFFRNRQEQRYGAKGGARCC